MSTYLNNFPENFNKFSFRPTTSSIVFTHLNRLSKTKSTGLDNPSAKLIREKNVGRYKITMGISLLEVNRRLIILMISF